MQNYTDFPSLEDVYLEDSYVLGISEQDGTLVFRLEAVLTPGHPRYRAPRPGEQHRYVDGTLTLGPATEIRWLRRSPQTYVDAAGDTDLGNIDTFVQREGRFEIEGDWGHVVVRTEEPPRFDITSAD